MPKSPADTASLIAKIMEAESVEAATAILRDAGYELSAVVAKAPETAGKPPITKTPDAKAAPPKSDADTEDEDEDEAPEGPGKARRKKGFAFLRDKMSDKF